MRSSVLFAKSVVSLAALAAAGTAMAQKTPVIEGDSVFETGPVLDGVEEREPGSDWTSSERLVTGTDELRPGRFTAFGETEPIENRLLVGVHPGAGTGIVRARARAVEPPAELRPDPAGEGLTDVASFYEISVEDVDGTALRTAHDTGFVLALPVPERLDEEALVPVAFAEGDLTTNGVGDRWVELSGAYDPDTSHAILSLESLGSATHPTRIGLITRSGPGTMEPERVLRPILFRHFPKAESAENAEEETIPELGDFTGPGARGEALEEGVRPEEGMALLSHRSDHTAEWTFRCRGASSCSQSLQDEIRRALDAALAEYVNLDGGPRPSISTTLGSKFMPNTSVYKINIIREDYTPVNVFLEGGDYCNDNAGWYTASANRLAICSDVNDAAATAAHELFHSIQHNLASHWSSTDDIVVEATAKLAEDWTTFEVKRSYVSPDTTRALAGMSYDADIFYSHLLRNDGNVDFNDLGDLFARGAGSIARRSLEFDPSLRRWVRDETSGDLGDAYWAFAKDFVFENDIDLGGYDCGLRDGSMVTNTVSFSASDPSASIPDDEYFDTVSHTPLSTRVWRLELPAYGFQPYRVIATAGEHDYMMKIYDAGAAAWEPTGCRSGGREASGASTVELPVYGLDKTAYLIVSDLVEDEEVTTDNWAAHNYNLELRIEPVPESDIPYPVAGDTSVTLPPREAGTHSIDALALTRNPHGPDSRLEIAEPGPGGKTTPGGNGAKLASPASGEIVWERRRADFFGADRFTYTAENARTGLQDEGTIEVVRTKRPAILDDRPSVSTSTAEAWERGGWRRANVEPIEIDVLANDYNPLDFPTSTFDRRLHIVSVGARHGTVEIDESGPREMLLYWPHPDGEQAWSGGPSGPRLYEDAIRYVARNGADEQGEADVRVIHLRPDGGGGDGGPGLPEGLVCAVAERGEAAAVTVLRGEEPASFARPPGAQAWQPIETPRGALSVQDVGPDGTVVGWTLDEARGSTAFVWRPEGGLAELPAPEGFGGAALAINAEGAAAGMVIDPESSVSTAVVWRDGEMRRASDRLEGVSLATDIDDQGRVIGVHGGRPLGRGGRAGIPDAPDCGDLGDGPPGLGRGDGDPVCPGERFGGYIGGDRSRGFIASPGERGQPGGVGSLRDRDGMPFIPRDIGLDGRASGFIPQRPGGPVCPTFAGRAESSNVQPLQPLSEDAYSDAFASGPGGVVAGISGDQEGIRRSVIWRDGQVHDLNELVSLPDGSNVVSATSFDNEGRLVLLVRDAAGQTRMFPVSLEQLGFGGEETVEIQR